jgi:hypothetical protein
MIAIAPSRLQLILHLYCRTAHVAPRDGHFSIVTPAEMVLSGCFGEKAHEDLAFQDLPGQHTLKLDNFDPGSGELGGSHYGLAGGHRSQHALALEFAPLKQHAS